MHTKRVLFSGSVCAFIVVAVAYLLCECLVYAHIENVSVYYRVCIEYFRIVA